MGRKLEAVLEVVSLQPNQSFSLKSVKAPFPVTTSYTFASEGDATRVNAVLDLEPSGFFKLAEGVLLATPIKKWSNHSQPSRASWKVSKASLPKGNSATFLRLEKGCKMSFECFARASAPAEDARKNL